MNPTTSNPRLLTAWSVMTPAYARYSNRGEFKDSPRSKWEAAALRSRKGAAKS